MHKHIGVDLQLSCFTLIVFMVAIILYPNLAQNIHYFGYFVSFLYNISIGNHVQTCMFENKTTDLMYCPHPPPKKKKKQKGGKRRKK